MTRVLCQCDVCRGLREIRESAEQVTDARPNCTCVGQGESLQAAHYADCEPQATGTRPEIEAALAIEGAELDASLYGTAFVMIEQHEDGSHTFKRISPERVQVAPEDGRE